ncbi:SpoIIE family protein phosphatase [Streptomyces sp. URMC 129]|uniref:SpoIIE family protein phosphatase n=1 Tax=Streptomyces sp. URMC 129 TaxID=3423407 RepID=UPI003F1952FB
MGANRDDDSPRGRALSPGERLHVLRAQEEEQNDREVLLAALYHAGGELDGLGGMVHLYGARTIRVLRLVTTCGLPQVFTNPWRDISADGSAAPATVFREGGCVWRSTVEPPEPGFGHESAVSRLTGVPEGTGIAAAALPGPEGPLGALSVLTSPSAGQPDEAQRAFFEEVAGWAARRLRLFPDEAEGVSPTLLEPPDPAPGRARALRTAGVGTWDWDLRTGDLAVDDMLLQEVGIDPEGFDRHIGTWVDRIHPDDLPWMMSMTDRAIRSRTPLEYEFRLRRSDGTYGWVRARRGVVLGEDGEPARLVGTVWDTTQTHAATESVGRALRHMSDGFLSVNDNWRIEFVNVTAEKLLGSAPGLIGRTLWEVPVIGSVPGLEERARRATAEGKPGGLDVRWPDSDRWYHLRLVPVPGGGLTLYIIDITERRRREAEQRSAAERARLIGRLTHHLAEAVTVANVVDAVADSVLPAFGATGLAVFSLDKDRLDVVGLVGYDHAFRDHVHGLSAAVTTPLGQALRTRTPQFIESTDAYTARYPETAELAAASGKQAWAFLPLTVSGRDIGAAVVSFGRPRRLADDERALLTALSGLIAQGLERAGLFDEATTRARELQRALLPQELPSLPAVTAAARYLPAGAATEVGGDWYDVIPLSSDRVALVVGDVMGHGMAEAAIMGRLRTAVRTLADLELPPDELLARLNDIVTELGGDRFATCMYGIYDPVSGGFSYASAGHPSPAVVRPGGTTTFPTHIPDPPLGVAAPPLATVETHLPDGSLLALYTDGLVSSFHHDLGHGRHRLARLLDQGSTDDPDALCDTVTRELLGDRRGNDDAALLIARTHRLAPENVASWPLPDDPVAAREARRHIREQLAAWELEELEMTTELIVSELVGNVIRHATGPIGLRLLRSRTLICEVSDGSLTTPHIRHPALMDEGGRGLRLVTTMAQRWGTRHTAHGKHIWAEQPIPTANPPPHGTR